MPAPVVRIESLRFAVAGERVLEQVEGFGLEELQSVVEAPELADRGCDFGRGSPFRVKSPDPRFVAGNLRTERFVGGRQVSDGKRRRGTGVPTAAESRHDEQDRRQRPGTPVRQGMFPSPRRRVW